MSELKDFFGASVGAAGALIGLLFVAVTLAPEKVFGQSAEPQRRGQAIGAFTALANVFFVSLAAWRWFPTWRRKSPPPARSYRSRRSSAKA